MALNAYASEQRVFYSEEPTSYYGFQVTGTSFSDDIHPFASAAERARFLESVRKGTSLRGYDSFIVAALAALTTYGEGATAEVNDYTLRDAFPDDADAALEAAQEFIKWQ